jgi:hypothetical protein
MEYLPGSVVTAYFLDHSSPCKVHEGEYLPTLLIFVLPVPNPVLTQHLVMKKWLNEKLAERQKREGKGAEKDSNSEEGPANEIILFTVIWAVETYITL